VYDLRQKVSKHTTQKQEELKETKPEKLLEAKTKSRDPSHPLPIEK
jgi:hypothetical protein